MGNSMTKTTANQYYRCAQCGRDINAGNDCYKDGTVVTWLKCFIPGGLGGDAAYLRYCSVGCYKKAH